MNVNGIKIDMIIIIVLIKVVMTVRQANDVTIYWFQYHKLLNHSFNG